MCFLSACCARCCYLLLCLGGKGRGGGRGELLRDQLGIDLSRGGAASAVDCGDSVRKTKERRIIPCIRGVVCERASTHVLNAAAADVAADAVTITAVVKILDQARMRLVLEPGVHALEDFVRFGIA